jgi:type I restriction enzyme, S subunit
VELKPGYKHTEAGIIPEDWDTVSTANIVETDSPICYGVVQVGQDTHNGVPIVAIKYVKEIDSAPLHRTSITLERPFARSRVRGGDVLISIKGTIGRVGIVPKGFEGNISRDLARLRPNEKYSSEYIAYQLEAGHTQERISRAVVGTTRLEFSITALRQFKLAVPSTKEEQREIAKALSDVDALLESLDRLIAKKRDLKQAVMQQLLTGHTRLPGFHGEWEVKRLEDIAHIKTGSRNNEDKVEDGQYPFFVRSEVIERINSYSYDCEAILVPGEGRIGSIFHYIQGRFDVHQRVYAITQFKPEMCARFVHAYMAHKFGAWAMQNTVKATVDSLRLPTFRIFEMTLPPTFAEQTAIAAILSDMDAELAGIEQRRNKTRNLKQAMMQELLTGKTRLVSPGGSHA